jgi:hypothetical protein
MVNAGNDAGGKVEGLLPDRFAKLLLYDAVLRCIFVPRQLGCRCLLGSVFIDSAQGELPSKLDFFSLSLMIVIRWRQLPRHLLHSC